jgi:integrase
MTVYKRGESYHYDFVVNRQRFTGNTYCAKKADALIEEARVRERERRRLAGQLGEEITLKDGLARYLSKFPPGDQQFRSVRSRVRRLLGEYDDHVGMNGDMLVSTITTAHVSRLVADRQQEDMAPNTIRLEIATLKAAINDLHRQGYACPVRIEYEMPKPTSKTRHLTSDEERQLLEAMLPANKVQTTTWPSTQVAPADVVRGWQDLHDLTVALLDTGARYSEMTSLLWLNVDFDANTITVRRWKTKQYATFVMTKRLREIMERRRDTKRSTKDVFVFPGKELGSHRKGNVDGIVDVMDKLGFNSPELVEQFGRCTVHSLRHTYASKLGRLGLAQRKAQDMLGHSDPRMTQRYQHFFSKEVAEEVADALDRATAR